jgi:hypothetical protein
MPAQHVPTDETRAQVYALSSFGVKQDDIGGFLGISDDTLRKWYPDELARASVERNAEVAAFLFRSANGSTIPEGASYSDCLKAAMFWMKTRAGWREKQEIDHTSSDGTMTPQGIPDDVKSALDAIAGKISGGNSEG